MSVDGVFMPDDYIVDVCLLVEVITHIHELVIAPKSFILRMIDVVESPIILSA